MSEAQQRRRRWQERGGGGSGGSSSACSSGGTRQKQQQCMQQRRGGPAAQQSRGVSAGAPGRAAAPPLRGDTHQLLLGRQPEMRIRLIYRLLRLRWRVAWPRRGDCRSQSARSDRCTTQARSQRRAPWQAVPHHSGPMCRSPTPPAAPAAGRRASCGSAAVALRQSRTQPAASRRAGVYVGNRHVCGNISSCTGVLLARRQAGECARAPAHYSHLARRWGAQPAIAVVPAGMCIQHRHIALQQRSSSACMQQRSERAAECTHAGLHSTHAGLHSAGPRLRSVSSAHAMQARVKCMPTVLPRHARAYMHDAPLCSGRWQRAWLHAWQACLWRREAATADRARWVQTMQNRRHYRSSNTAQHSVHACSNTVASCHHPPFMPPAVGTAASPAGRTLPKATAQTAAPMHSPSHSTLPAAAIVSSPPPPPSAAAPAITSSGIRCSSRGCAAAAPGACRQASSEARRSAGGCVHAEVSQSLKAWQGRGWRPSHVQMAAAEALRSASARRTRRYAAAQSQGAGTRTALRACTAATDPQQRARTWPCSGGAAPPGARPMPCPSTGML